MKQYLFLFAIAATGCMASVDSSPTDIVETTAESEDAISTHRACGLDGLPDCPDGMFCSFSVSAACGDAGAPGQCTTIPDFCTREYKPVCGCDDVTYPNACSAQSVGVSVQHKGICGS